MFRLRIGERAALGAGLAVCIGVFFATEWGLYLRQNEQVAQQRVLAMSSAAGVRASVDQELDALLNLTASLSSYLETRPAPDRVDAAEIQALLANLYGKSRNILRFSVAVGYRLTYVYPVQGNAEEIGLYYPDVPARWAAVQRAIASRTGTLSGPTQRAQGSSLIYRMPVYIHGRYWGLLSTVIDATGLFNAALLHDMPAHVDVAIRGRDGLGAEGDVFWGDARLFDDPKAALLVAEVPGGHWLYAVRAAGAAADGLYFLWHAAAFFFSAGLGFLVYKLQKKRYELAVVARIDPLTQLTNRREFETIVEGAFERRRKLDYGDFALLFLDLDRFKIINDTYGHDAGDTVLVTVARRLRSALRDDDVIGRWGGDEFVVFVRNSSPEVIDELIRRARAALAEPIFFNGVELNLGVAIGVAVYSTDGDSVRALFRVADERMYRDKQLNLLNRER